MDTATDEKSSPTIEIDLDQALSITLPVLEKPLMPLSFRTPDGLEGWVLGFAERRPIATPAYADGKLFVAYPANQFRPVFSSSMSMDERRAAIAEAKKKRHHADYDHRMLCADLHTGKHQWETEIAADVIAAPVVSGGQLFFTCVEGTSFCLAAGNGEVIWSKKKAGTSTPLVVGGHVVMMHKEDRDGMIHESLKRSSGETGEDADVEELFSRKSPYLHVAYGGGSGLKHGHAAGLDAAVGFATAPQTIPLPFSHLWQGVHSSPAHPTAFCFA